MTSRKPIVPKLLSSERPETREGCAGTRAKSAKPRVDSLIRQHQNTLAIFFERQRGIFQGPTQLLG